MRRLRIAFIVSEFPSVSETFILSQITGLLDMGHAVDIYAKRQGPRPVIHQEVDRYRLRERTRYMSDFSLVKGRLRRLKRAAAILTKHAVRHPAWVRRWVDVVRSRRPYEALDLLFRLAPFWDADYDVIHAHFGPNGNQWLFLKEFTRAKFVCSFYGYDVSSYLQERGNDAYRELFARGDLFVAMSDHMRARLEALGCDRSRLAVQRLGVDTSRFTPVNRPNAPGRPARILTVARLVEKKGHEFAIRAIAQVVKTHPDLTYQIAGEGALEGFLRSLIRELSLGRHVSLLGAQRNEAVARLMAEADIFLLPSITAASGDQEGIPVSLSEAQASGLPVVATRHSGIAELVEDGRSGFLVPERDAAALADRLHFLIEHAEVRRQFGERGRRIVEARYNVARLNSRLEQLYRAVLDGATPASFDQGDEGQAGEDRPDVIAIGGVCIQPPGCPQHRLPVVSVIVPVFNGERTIGACLESLLAQEYPRDQFEVIVVNNNSRDCTAEIVQRYPVTYILEDRVQSSYAARNAGIRVARGDILAFTDADCVASPQWLAKGVRGFADARVGCVAGEIRSPQPRTFAQRYATARELLSQAWALSEGLGFKPFAQTANAFYRKSVLERLGGFDPALISGGDADLSWRMQDGLGMQITLRQEAAVFHTHRETVRALLRQRVGYGYGSVLLYLKHRQWMGRRTLKHTYRDARSLGRKVRRLAVACARNAVGRNGNTPEEPVSVQALGILVFLARKAGQVKGSIKHRVWYV